VFFDVSEQLGQFAGTGEEQSQGQAQGEKKFTSDLRSRADGKSRGRWERACGSWRAKAVDLLSAVSKREAETQLRDLLLREASANLSPPR
jgi:hypothetical protein